MRELKINKRNDLYNSVEISLDKHLIKDAISTLRQFLQSVKAVSNLNELENIETSYNYMIHYLTTGSNDPMRGKMYNDLLLRLYTLNDKVSEGTNISNGLSLYYTTKRNMRNGATLKQRFDEYAHIQKELDKLNIPDKSARNKVAIASSTARAEQVEYDIFKYVWTMSFSCAEDIALLRSIFAEERYSENFRLLLISALLLSISEAYCTDKLCILFDEYAAAHSPRLKAYALVAIVVLSFHYYNRMVLTESIMNRINELRNDSEFHTLISAIALIFVKCSDTERISDKMQREVLPQIMRSNPDLMSKIRKRRENDDEEEDVNSEWHEMIENSGVEEQLRELTEMQMDGGDVFMSTFSHLKSFPFFNLLSNWFLPFSTEHSLFVNSNDNVFESINSANLLCNSDKYSLALSLDLIPASDRTMMLNQMSEQNEQLREDAKERASYETERMLQYISCYLHDLYRFCKLHSRRSEFLDFFKFRPFIDGNLIIDILKDNTKSVKIVADYLFKREYYASAASIYTVVINDCAATDLQKLGYCYQKQERYNDAIEKYDRADMLQSDNEWTLRHIAQCYKALGNKSQAIRYYNKALTLKPESMSLLLALGHLYLEMGNINSALKHYYKADYLSEGKPKTLRPIAWCEYLNRNYAASRKAYEKLFEFTTTTYQDYMNYGHLLLTLGNTVEAVQEYEKSLRKSKHDINRFRTELLGDLDILAERGVERQDVYMILENLSEQ